VVPEGFGEDLRLIQAIRENIRRAANPPFSLKFTHGNAIFIAMTSEGKTCPALRESSPMRVALCTRNPHNPVLQLLARALAGAGATGEIIDDPRRVLGDARWDVAFWRPDSRAATIAAFSRQAPVILDGLGVPFLNTLESMERAGSKLVSQALFTAASLPVIPSWLTPRPGRQLDEDIRGPLIVKPLWGKKGEGVALCGSATEALEVAWRLGRPSLLQRPVLWRNQYRCVATPERLVRVYRDQNPEVGVPAIRRFDRLAAIAEIGVPDEVAELAIAMIRAVDGDLMRADVLEDGEGGLWALEVNSSFGFPHDDEVVLDGFVQGFRAKVA
jgi:glutathione synthase/RimK-type ligase-like ATP-grasp enzyme